MERRDVLIVGGGHGGAQAAIALRQNGFAGSILIIGRDVEPPYERPALSKEYLAREKQFERILIRPIHFWDDRGVEFRLGTTVAMVDAAAHTVTFESGEMFAYGSLVWAAGGDPRQLSCPGARLGGIYYVRDRADADRMMAALDAGAKKIAVIGGGYVGLEVAAALIKLGRQVTLLEALPRVLARVSGEALSSFYEAEHRAHGVDLRTDAKVVAIEGKNGKATRVVLADGEIVPADIVVVGIGIVPAVEPLLKAQAKCANGIEVDRFCRTSLPDIYAIGDCAAHVNPFAGGSTIRLESVQNANDMAIVAAKAICGEPQPYQAMPWFWSNQYDLKLQTAGLHITHDTSVLRGDPSTRSFSVIYLRNGKIVALDCVNAAKDYVQGKKLIKWGIRLPAEKLADTTTTLKELAEKQNSRFSEEP